jgi:type VI secretion system secreted protein VgrG
LDSKFVTSTQISPVSVAFRLDANLGAGNIVITSIFKWGTVASGITDAEKADTIKQFKAKVADWGNRYDMKITDPECGEKTIPIRFRLLWSPDDTTDSAPYSVNLHRTYPRAGVSGFDIDIGYDSNVSPNSAWVLAHEYGHTLCLQDEYFYSGVSSATVTYMKADGSSEIVTLEPSSGNIMYLDGNTKYLKRFFYFTAIEAQALLRAESGRNVTCEVV